MSVLSSARRYLREYAMLDGADRVICALSGGADSVCLAHVMLSLAEETGVRVECAHYNHHLRGEESDRDEAFVREWCMARGLRLHLGSGDVAAFAREKHLGLEEAARVLRYGFLESLGDEDTRIATAHQAEDQAETLLLNLLRGSGLKGLGGIPPVRGRIIRPLLGVSRREILEYLAGEGLRYVEDSSNESDAFRRNQLRHQVLPLLGKIEPSFVKNCARTAALVARDEEYLATQAGALLKKEGESFCLSARELSSTPLPLASRAIRLACASFGVFPEEKHVSAVLSLAAGEVPSAAVDLPGGLCARRRYGDLLLGAPAQPASFPSVHLPLKEWTELPGTKMRVLCTDDRNDLKIHGKFTTYCFKKAQICGSITVRPRSDGDLLRLPGGQKSLKKRMIEEKIPALERGSIPVFADEAGVLAVYRLGTDVRAAAAPEEADLWILLEERKQTDG